ncbi:hypothetical protein ELUMI_v1c05000 [Williamsoniiplasma luminosum]|uniref:Uncharacterized protein n=1 Tax=Williamsoniiplasma luminosum TaxID=214888 RepID=A0A2K8NTY8_9MOLU|nr:hypothetical protein [Williamsoniiplasma luminosum]ATZ17224.1 hypothetical protein ELUMI_v1c05000 [Williamsoniiplasma luminosum]
MNKYEKEKLYSILCDANKAIIDFKDELDEMTQDDEEFTYCRRDCGDEEACVGHDEEFCEAFCGLEDCDMHQDDEGELENE